jgi:nicotinate dehydrogenase subunit B
LTGGFVNGWEAPALFGSPVAWTQDDLFQYLRTGFSPRHGAAGGSMAPIVAAMKGLPDEDIRAIADYLISLDPPRPGEPDAAAMREAQAAADAPRARQQYSAGARLYEGACAVCHEQGAGPPMFGVRPSLAVSSALSSGRPDNLIRTVLEGAHSALSRDLGAMPAFADALDDSQIAALTNYLRARFASQAPAWRDLAGEAARIRAALASERGGY